MDNGQIGWPEKAIADPAVLASWQRCAYRLDPRATPRPNQASEQTLTTVLKARPGLTETATPFMEDLHQFMEGSGCVILLADGTGCVHTLVGDQDSLDELEAAGLGRGTYWAEGQLGTIAPALALYQAMPALVIGPEHFYRAYHHLATAAAPVHDVRGRIAAVLTIVGPAETGSPHTLALAMSAARAISNQLHTNWYLDEANLHLSEVNAILGAVTEGVNESEPDGVRDSGAECFGVFHELDVGRRRYGRIGRLASGEHASSFSGHSCCRASMALPKGRRSCSNSWQ